MPEFSQGEAFGAGDDEVEDRPATRVGGELEINHPVRRPVAQKGMRQLASSRLVRRNR